MLTIAVLLAVVSLAYANGANDNFKGVATLLGSGTTKFSGALAWATITTLMGSVTAILLAGQLIKAFKGKGLVDESLVADPTYVAAVAMGAACTVLLATWLGMPVSTTHAMIGALIGSGLAAASSINAAILVDKLLKPLIISPFIAIAATMLVYPALKYSRKKLGITEETCICVGSEVKEVVPIYSSADIVLERVEHWGMTTGTTACCNNRYAGRLFGIEAAAALDKLHFLSAGIVSFARGLNDTPKIAALLLVAPAFSGFSACVAVGLVIALGGLLSARRVAETMSQKITKMNHGQGFTANVLAGIIIIGASKLGMPVSTTHVSCGALFGIGTITGEARWKTISSILVAWVTTLPLGGLLGYGSFLLLQSN
ncbi:MAG: inorganic phosphate transporter [Planctomycetes bacterium]|nr:inorganic phosphate transporter [Planctomycetota bacterium]